MEFNEFKKAFQDNFESMVNNQNFLFTVDVDRNTLWETYLESFRPKDNQVFHKRREFDCSCCRSFIKHFGNVVTIKNNQIVSIWDFDVVGSKFEPVVNALDDLVRSKPISSVFVTKQSTYGTDKSRELSEDMSVHVWQHFYLDLPERFISNSRDTTSSIAAVYQGNKDVFKRSLEEISLDSLEIVLDMIAENALYKGREWQGVLSKFLELHREYHDLPNEQKDNYFWSKSTELGGAISRIRNHSVGVLLKDITSGMDVLESVKRYEKIVAPTNYKRPKAIFTKRMVEEAQEIITELGLLDSLGRRHATLTDVTVNNVIWANRSVIGTSGQLGIFDVLKSEARVRKGSYDRLLGIHIDEFITDVLPSATSVDVLLENKHEGNLVSLIAPKIGNSTTMFKWGNGFSWAYNGNIADSMKQRVKAAGGNVDGVLRFSLQWNDNHDNQNDYDAHCIEPNHNHIWFSNKGRRHISSGMLDVDVIHPRSRVAVENITWTNIRKMPEGVYTFYVHNYSHNGGRSGFDAEIEFDGQIFEFEYHKDLPYNEQVEIARVRYSRQNGFEIVESMPTTTSTKKMWGLNTNQFHPVSVCMYSPNYWDGQKGIGHKHYFLMLAECENDTQPNGFFNEYLREVFMKHKQVFAALGNKMKVEPSSDQLSGLGFSSTKRDSLIIRVDNKPMKIVF